MQVRNRRNRIARFASIARRRQACLGKNARNWTRPRQEAQTHQLARRLTGRSPLSSLPARYPTCLPCRCEACCFLLEASVTERMPGLPDQASGFPSPLITLLETPILRKATLSVEKKRSTFGLWLYVALQGVYLQTSILAPPSPPSGGWKTGCQRRPNYGAGGQRWVSGKTLYRAAKNLSNLTGGYGIGSRESQSPCGFPGDVLFHGAHKADTGTSQSLSPNGTIFSPR